MGVEAHAMARPSSGKRRLRKTEAVQAGRRTTWPRRVRLLMSGTWIPSNSRRRTKKAKAKNKKSKDKGNKKKDEDEAPSHPGEYKLDGDLGDNNMPLDQDLGADDDSEGPPVAVSARRRPSAQRDATGGKGLGMASRSAEDANGQESRVQPSVLGCCIPAPSQQRASSKLLRPRTVRNMLSLHEWQRLGRSDILLEAARIYELLGLMNRDRMSAEALERRLNAAQLAEAGSTPENPIPSRTVSRVCLRCCLLCRYGEQLAMATACAWLRGQGQEVPFAC